MREGLSNFGAVRVRICCWGCFEEVKEVISVKAQRQGGKVRVNGCFRTITQ